ncbi:MAG: hypothetical protein JW793_08910 [Acidobacteria bacterium]|nr:hypothetical protein [Acidobacteriota bacterium]
MTDKRPYSRTGLNSLKAKVKLRGLQAIDQRTAAAQALLAWRRELFTDLGGEEACNPEKKALVDLAVRTRLFIESVDYYLLNQPSVVSVKHRAILPALRERQVLADSLVRILERLGIGSGNGQKPVDLAAMLAGASR